jgi:hypothetical protein
LALQLGLETLDRDSLGYLSLYTPWQNVVGAAVQSGWQALTLGNRARGALLYAFTRESLEAVLLATPRDESAEQVHADIAVTTALEAAGKRCWFHVPSLCDHAGSAASTLGHPASPLIAGFEFQAGRRMYRPDLSTTLPGRLAVVTCYFNPSDSAPRLHNYQEFARQLETRGGDLWTVEVAFGEQPFQLPAGPRMLQLRSPDWLWPKEQALNILIRRLPPEYDKVAWVDADVVFDNPRWVADVSAALEQDPVVQPFSEVLWLDEAGQPQSSSPSVVADPRGGLPGLAWAARRDLVQRWGLYAADASSCNDVLIWLGLSGRLDHPTLSCYPEPVRQHLSEWQARIWPGVQGQLGAVAGTLRHLDHGPFRERRYRERIRWLEEFRFDPERDLVLRDNGLLGWSGRNPGLEARSAEFLLAGRGCGVPRTTAAAAAGRVLADALERVEIRLPAQSLRGSRCIATVATAGFEDWLDGFFSSLAAHGACDDALWVVFLVGESVACERVAHQHGAQIVPCVAREALGTAVKSALYSVARVVDAEAYLCLDVDTLILGELQSVFQALTACRPDAILVARDGSRFSDLADALGRGYSGSVSDLSRLGVTSDRIARYPLGVNDGVFAGRREAMLALDRELRAMPNAAAWVAECGPATMRNQFVFNLVLAQRDCAVELDPRFNAQYHDPDTQITHAGHGLQATYAGQPVHILHLTGSGAKTEFVQWRKALGKNVFSQLGGGRDGYAEFLSAIRRWVQQRGLAGLSDTFYGNRFGVPPRVRDPATCSLWGTLFHLIRSHGCTRVLETGTSRGISAGCLASAVVDRRGSRVVTVDVEPPPERHDFWRLLPGDTQAVIEQRRGDSLAILAAAREAGETFHAALLDSQHTAAFVRDEFERARQVVTPGGLILIHDIHPAFFDTGKAINEIQALGFGVVRLWCGEQSLQTDDRLGLAVIENQHLP